MWREKFGGNILALPCDGRFTWLVGPVDCLAHLSVGRRGAVGLRHLGLRKWRGARETWREMGVGFPAISAACLPFPSTDVMILAFCSLRAMSSKFRSTIDWISMQRKRSNIIPPPSYNGCLNFVEESNFSNKAKFL